MQNETKKPPVKVFICGSVKAAVWLFPKIRDGAVVDVASVTITKFYKDKGTEQWETTDFLNPDDLPKVVTVATEAYKYLRLKSPDLKGQPDSSCLSEGAE